MKFLKLILALSLFTVSLSAQSILGGAGTIKTNGDPDAIVSLQVINQRATASIAVDTTNGNVYTYDVTKTVGSRWVVINPTINSIVGGGDISVSTVNGVSTISYTDADKSQTNETITAFSVTSGNLRITEAGTNRDVPITSIAPVQSVVAGGSLAASTVANVTTVSYTDPDASATNEIQTISSSAPASNAVTVALNLSGGSYTITGGAGIQIGGSANALTIVNTAAPPSTQYDNDTSAGVGGVAIGSPYRASTTNSMGLPAGTVVYRNF